MNCKPGDLAVVIRSEAGNEGRIVRCVKLIGLTTWLSSDGSIRQAWKWEIDQRLPDWKGFAGNAMPDDCLHPIRPPGKPVEERHLMGVPA